MSFAGQRVIQTPRLELSRLGPDDAEFIVELLNDTAFLQYVGDKKVRDRAGAVAYIRTGPMASYAENGFGLYRTNLREGGDPIGICGLLRRDYLDAADLGFALLPRYRTRGYAHEAAAAVLRHAREQLGLERVLAITAPDNAASIGLLHKLGFRLERRLRRGKAEPELLVFEHDDSRRTSGHRHRA